MVYDILKTTTEKLAETLDAAEVEYDIHEIVHTGGRDWVVVVAEPGQMVDGVLMEAKAQANPGSLAHVWENGVITEDEYRDALGLPRKTTVGEDAAAHFVHGDDVAVTPSESDGEMLARLGTNGGKWAHEFYRRFSFAIDGDKLDEGTMIGWFANAIEAGRTAGQPQGVRIFAEPPGSDTEASSIAGAIGLQACMYNDESLGYTGFIEDKSQAWIIFLGPHYTPVVYWPRRARDGSVVGAPIDMTT